MLAYLKIERQGRSHRRGNRWRIALIDEKKERTKLFVLWTRNRVKTAGDKHQFMDSKKYTFEIKYLIIRETSWVVDFFLPQYGDVVGKRIPSERREKSKWMHCYKINLFMASKAPDYWYCLKINNQMGSIFLCWFYTVVAALHVRFTIIQEKYLYYKRRTLILRRSQCLLRDTSCLSTTIAVWLQHATSIKCLFCG